MKFCPYCGASLLGAPPLFALNAAGRSRSKSQTGQPVRSRIRRSVRQTDRLLCVGENGPGRSCSGRPGGRKTQWISTMTDTMTM